MAVIIGEVSSQLANFNAMSSKKASQLELLTTAINTLRIPNATRERLFTYHEYCWVRDRCNRSQHRSHTPSH